MYSFKTFDPPLLTDKESATRKYKRIYNTCLFLGFLAIATTYLPTPWDNLSYFFIILFVGMIIKSYPFLQSYTFSFNPNGKQHLYKRLALRDLLFVILICVFCLATFLIGAIVVSSHIDPTTNPNNMTPFIRFLYEHTKGLKTLLL